MEKHIIETERLKLRPMQFEDLDAIFQIVNAPGVRRYLFDDKPVSSAFVDEIYRQSASNFELREFGIWVIEEKLVAELIGLCGLRTVEELVSESKWHLGYAIEAGRAVKCYAFDRVGLDRLVGITDAANVQSWRVLDKLEMREYRPANPDISLRYAIATRESAMITKLS